MCACRVHVAALLLKRKMERYGNNWRAIGAYHSTNPAKSDVYSAKVRRVYEGIQQLRGNGESARRVTAGL